MKSGIFLSSTFSTFAGSYPYKLYIPSSYSRGRPAPLLVALHGCTQDPDNFAAGTRFNLLAETYNFLVLYPQQTSAYQPNKCWTWYDSNHQARGRGEPAIIVGMVDEVKSRYTIDTNRVFITGMSAGGAMAVIMGACYPDYFAAIGVHSGLEYKAASDLSSANIAMIKGGPDPTIQGRLAYQSAGSAARILPVIVFHGKNDYTVYPINGDQVIQQFAVSADYADDGVANDSVQATPGNIEVGQVPNGYSYTISNYNYKGQLLLQKYDIDTLGHAWSGGSTTPPATFTDPRGPDASLIMWNFFASHPKIASTPFTTSTTTFKSDRWDSDKVVEGVFREMPEEVSSSTSSSKTATLAPTRVPALIPGPTRSSTESVTVTLHPVANESGYVMNNFPYPGDLSAGSLAGIQQFGILSFDTSSIPANATIESITLKINRNYASAGNAYGNLGSLVVDIKDGNGFSESTALQGSDGTAPADASAVCTMSVASGAGATSQGSIAPGAFRHINRTGRTQFRLRFTIAPVNSYSTDYVGFYGGQSTQTQANRPILIITYY